MLTREYLEEFNSPIRSIKGRAELFTNSALSAFGKYVTFENPIEKVKVKVASKNIFDLEAYSGTFPNVTPNSRFGTTYSTTEPINGVTITQTKYPITSGYITSYENGYSYWLLKEHLVVGQEYTLSFDIEILSNPLNTFEIATLLNNSVAYKTMKYDGKPFEVGKKYRLSRNFVYGIDEKYPDLKGIEFRNAGMSLILSNIQIERGTTASEYTPYMSLEGGRGSLYYEGVYGNELGETYMGDSGIYTVSEWYWYDSGELSISFEDGYYLYVSTNGLGYETPEDLLADLEIPIGTQLYYDTETDSLYRIAEGLVGSTITVGGKNVLDLEGYAADAYKNLYNSSGTTVNTKEPLDSVIITQTKYPNPDNTGNWSNGYMCIHLKEPLKENQEYSISYDIEILANPINTKSLLMFFNGNYGFNSEDNHTPYEVGKKYRIKGKCVYQAYSDRKYIEIRVGGMSFVLSNIQIELGSTASEYTPYQKPTVYTIDDTLTVEAISYTPTTVIYPNNSGIFIEKAECKVCKCGNTFTHDGKLKGIKIDRVGENGKFFGYGIAQKATINLVDTNREENILKDDFFKAYFNLNDKDFESTFPAFYVAEVKRNENTNEITVTAEDRLYKAAVDTFADLGISTESTLAQYTEAIASFYGLNLIFTGAEFNLDAAGGNFEGTESLRQVLNGIAEATQTIYYISGNALIFKRLNLGSAADLAIEKQHYFSLESKEPVTLGAVCHTTELGDNVISSSIGGETQYIRDNPFWELKENIGDIVEAASQAVQGLTITPFTCSWRGNFLTEIGDKLLITAKDGSTIETYMLTDSINYNGGYSQKTEWSYEASNQTAANPATLGEKLNQTFARVDKVNKQIELVVTKTDKNSDAISALTTNATSINATVSRVEKQQSANSETIAELSNKVEAQITADDVTLSIQSALQDGVDKVETATGFTFNEEGLTVSKSGSEISTQITEDGMNISKSGEEVLTANNEGVKAQDLHATTFLLSVEIAALRISAIALLASGLGVMTNGL